MTVARLRREMSSQEYMEWGIYYARQAQQQQLAELRGR